MPWAAPCPSPSSLEQSPGPVDPIFGPFCILIQPPSPGLQHQPRPESSPGHCSNPWLWLPSALGPLQPPWGSSLGCQARGPAQFGDRRARPGEDLLPQEKQSSRWLRQPVLGTLQLQKQNDLEGPWPSSPPGTRVLTTDRHNCSLHTRPAQWAQLCRCQGEKAALLTSGPETRQGLCVG